MRGMALCRAVLSAREEVSPGVFVLGFRLEDAPVSRPAPGQFFNVDCGGGREHLLRRPLSVHDAGPGLGDEAGGDDLLTFMVEVVGWGTGRLCSLDPGSSVSMLGPLGRPFDFAGTGRAVSRRGEMPGSGAVTEGLPGEQTGGDGVSGLGARALLVAGGMGIAPIFYLAREMDRSGCDYDLLAGFPSGERYYQALGLAGGGLEIFTEDATVGRGGLVSEGVGPGLDRGGYSAVMTCGPEPMMEAVAAEAERRGVPCQVSLVSRMACGIGACRGCVREGRDGDNLCVCSEGPVFDSRRVAWKAGVT